MVKKCINIFLIMDYQQEENVIFLIIESLLNTKIMHFMIGYININKYHQHDNKLNNFIYKENSKN